MENRGVAAVLVSVAVFLFSGCVLRGPSGIKAQVESSSGRVYDREFGMTIGRTGLGIARWAMRAGDEQEAAHMLKGINKVQVGIYQVVDNGFQPGRKTLAYDFRPFYPIVELREEDEKVMVLALEKHETIRKLLVVVDSDQELVIVRLRGNLEHVIEDAIRLGLEQGDREEWTEPVIEEYRRSGAGPETVYL